MRGRIFVIDDDLATCEVLAEGLGNRGFAISFATDPTKLVGAISDTEVVLTDLNMGRASGLDICRAVTARRPDVPVVVITAFGSLQTAIAAIQAGAYDFITKPFDLDAVGLALDRAVSHHRLRATVSRLEREVAEKRPAGMLGESEALERVCSILGRIADSDASVVLLGESGTGKDLAAKYLHDAGTRRNAAFVAVNCSAIPETLLESELFGHARGAFTDAKVARDGMFVRAHGGTLFLDEIGDLPAALQPKLLRALETRSVRPLGSSDEVAFDARIVAATHRDIESDVAAGRFRHDLWFRLNVISVQLPPLRTRGNDVLLLAYHFARKAAERAGRPPPSISPQAAELLLAHDWPGNVRELSNAMERAFALSRSNVLLPDDLPDRIRERGSPHVLISADEPTDLVPLDEVERRYVLRVLDVVRGNKTLAAQILRLDRSTLYRKLERWGVDVT